MHTQICGLNRRIVVVVSAIVFPTQIPFMMTLMLFPEHITDNHTLPVKLTENTYITIVLQHKVIGRYILHWVTQISF